MQKESMSSTVTYPTAVYMHVTGHVGHFVGAQRGQECARKVVVAAASTGLPPYLETGGLQVSEV